MTLLATLQGPSTLSVVEFEDCRRREVSKMTVTASFRQKEKALSPKGGKTAKGQAIRAMVLWINP